MNNGVVLLLILLFVLMISGMGVGAYMYSLPEEVSESPEPAEPAELRIVKYINNKFSSPGYYGTKDECKINYPNGIIKIVGDELLISSDWHNPGSWIHFPIISKSDTKLSANKNGKGIQFTLIEGELYGKESHQTSTSKVDIIKCR